jgi:hypothetical protein
MILFFLNIDNLFNFLPQLVVYLFVQLRARRGWHELSLGNAYDKLRLLGQRETLPERIALLVLAGLAVMLRPGKTPHLRGDGGIRDASPVVYSGIRHAGEYRDGPVSRRVFDASRQMVPARKQRPVPGSGSFPSASLPPRLLPWMEAVVGETSLAEIILDMSFGNIPGNDGHFATDQLLELFPLLQDPAVKFLYIHLYIK